MSKLVRDKIPEIIRAHDGVDPVCRIISHDAEFRQALDAKLDEEIAELRSALDEKSRVEEIADVMEVLLAIARRDGHTPEQIEDIRIQKRDKRGGFELGIILEQ
ncbi:MAG: nucleoside triphosphate pyrophosphohydrolase [Candidatus Gracilibacteria bacterium]|nr:nucleoside triphosphate pyrophosphohydrolase [Candidatus Gracilibacteria bacterium]